MNASARSSSYSYVVDEALLCAIATDIQAAIPGAEVRLFGSRTRGSVRPDKDLKACISCLGNPYPMILAAIPHRSSRW